MVTMAGTDAAVTLFQVWQQGLEEMADHTKFTYCPNVEYSVQSDGWAMGAARLCDIVS
jgi:hypothetical protein